MNDPIRHSGRMFEHPVCDAVELCEELPFNLGSAIVFLWRADDAHDISDLRGALGYLQREAARTRQVHDDARVGAVDMGVPIFAKKLARVIAKNRATNTLLRDVLLSVADDNETFSVAVAMIEQAIAAAEASEREAQEAAARAAQGSAT